jgi:hypothetical protein
LPVAVIAAQIDLGFAQHPWKSAALVLFAAALAAGLTAAWTGMRVTVTPEGLHERGSTWEERFVQWDSMIWARPTRWLLGLPYLRVGLDDGRSPVWLPLFLVDMPRFVALVSQHAGATHPLTVALSHRVPPGGVRPENR